MKETWWARLTERLGGRNPERARGSGPWRARLAEESENAFNVGGRRLGESERDRGDWEREQVLRQALEAWRVNPLARRIVGLTTQYVVGGGIAVSCKHETTARFLKRFWEHPLNRMEVRVREWCDELTRSGNLFVLLATDAAGFSYVRALPAAQVESIESRENDLEQALHFKLHGRLEDGDAPVYPAYDPAEDGPGSEGRFPAVVLHYAVNRPVGAQWGEPDLAPALRWLARYANWLEDRARLNRFRNTFLYVVKARFTSESERRARQQALSQNPPPPGSILVADESETWEVLSPKLESAEANTDGLALKKMIASGAGLPLHFLAEPESSTRTTAEAAGGPTYRHFEQRQQYFLWMLGDLLRAVVQRRSLVDRRVSTRAEVSLLGGDISARDNVALALAANNLTAVLRELRARQLIDDSEFLRLAYRFCGETVDVEEMLARGRAAGALPETQAGSSPEICRQPVTVDAASGEWREKENI